MTRKTDLKSTTARLALIGVAVASLAACSSKPKTPPVQTAPTTPQTEAPRPPGQQPITRGPDSAPPQGAAPGSVQDFLISAGDRIYFDFEGYTVREDARAVLDTQAAWLSRYPQVQIRIEGNADERGTVDYNFALGARRANAVRDYLVSKGIAASRIETVSYGKSRPIDPRPNDEGWAINRNAHTAITGGAR